MKHVSRVTPMASARLVSDSPVMNAPVQPLGEVDAKTGEVVEKIFRQLQAIYPAWRQAWPDDKALSAARRSWTRGLMAAGIRSLEQVQYGIERCRMAGSPFAPSIGQFIEWCQPTAEMLGLPPLEKAYAEAVRNSHPAASATWSHPAVHHAACETGFFALSTMQEEASRKLFARNYTVTMRMLIAGEPLRAIPLALPEAVSVCTPEVGRSALATLRSALRGAAQ